MGRGQYIYIYTESSFLIRGQDAPGSFGGIFSFLIRGETITEWAQRLVCVGRWPNCDSKHDVQNDEFERWSKSPATRNRTRDHLISATLYSQMLYQLSYSRSCLSNALICTTAGRMRNKFRRSRVNLEVLNSLGCIPQAGSCRSAEGRQSGPVRRAKPALTAPEGEV